MIRGKTVHSAGKSDAVVPWYFRELCRSDRYGTAAKLSIRRLKIGSL